MSNYDDIHFKSIQEIRNRQIPTNEVKENFKEEFIQTFENIKVQDLKNMLYLNPKEEIKFDYVFNKSEIVTVDFFNNNKIFNENASVDHKINIMMEFFESTNDIITPKHLKQIFEELLGILNTDMTEDDYEMMIFQIFKKYQINLRDEKDKETFHNFLKESLEVDKHEDIVDLLPSVNKKSNDKIKNSTKSEIRQKANENKIMMEN